jgi:hypothetical protein
MMEAPKRVCKNCAHWKPDGDRTGYGECLAASTVRLITPAHHRCMGDLKVFRFKEKEGR